MLSKNRASIVVAAGWTLAFLGATSFWRLVKRWIRTRLGRGRLAADAPGRLPLLGHLLFMRKLQKIGIWDYISNLHLRDSGGRTLRMVVGPEFAPLKVFTFTTDPVNVKHILKDSFSKYGKGANVREVFREFAGQGIFVADGEGWMAQRKIAAGIFSRTNFRTVLTNVFQQHARRLISLLRRQQDREVDLQTYFFSFTLDAFCEIGFGFPWDSLESPTPAKQKWAQSFDFAQSVIVTRFAYRPLWKLERLLMRIFGRFASAEEANFAESVRFMNEAVDDILDEKFKRIDDKTRTKENDLLSLFLETTRDRSYLRDVVMNFVIAGRDTTACTLTWLFWELARHPDAYAEVRREVLREQGPGGQDIGFEGLSRLKFSTACVRETIRLHPPVPSDPKEALEDDVLPDGTLVCQGDYVFFQPYAMGRDTRLWGSDAADWRPERWLEMEVEPSTFVNCAFQAGPRICLGRDMALLEAKIVLVEFVLSGIRWEVRQGYSPTYRYPSIVLPMEEPGLPVRCFFSERSG